MANDLVTEIIIPVVTVVGSGVFAYFISRSQGEKAAQKYMIEEQYKSSHQKRIVNHMMEIWGKTLSEPHGILDIQRDYTTLATPELRIDFSPFVEDEQISYFESHLKSGYAPVWAKIEIWKDSYSKLVERTRKLAEKIRIFIEEFHLLPEYDRLRSSEEYINYIQLVISYFAAVLFEIQKLGQFEIKRNYSTRNGTKWFNLFVPADHQTIAESPDEEKINKLKKRIEELHSDPLMNKEFVDMFEAGKALNAQLKDILQEIRKLWAEVNNNVPLKGFCEPGLKGKFETEKGNKDERA